MFIFMHFYWPLHPDKKYVVCSWSLVLLTLLRGPKLASALTVLPSSFF